MSTGHLVARLVKTALLVGEFEEAQREAASVRDDDPKNPEAVAIHADALQLEREFRRRLQARIAGGDVDDYALLVERAQSAKANMTRPWLMEQRRKARGSGCVGGT